MTCQSERLKFWAALVGAATIAVWSIPASAETVRVRSIRVSETAGDTSVFIAASARPIFTTWKLEQPARVVVELSGTRLGDVNVPIDAGTYALGLVSASVTEDESAGPRTRIVLTLRQASDYRVESKGNDITLRIVPRVRPDLAAEGNAKARIQAESHARAEAQRRAEQQTKVAAQAKAEAAASAEAQKKIEARLHDEERQRLAAEAKAKEHSRSEAAAKLEADRLRSELTRAQQEAAKARAEATAASQESQRQRLALAQAEARARQAEADAENARQRADSSENKAAAARSNEMDRDKALRAATAEVEARQTALDRIALRQREHQSQLEEAARLVSEREASVRMSEAKLAKSEQQARAARARHESLASDASSKGKAAAAAALVEAERQRNEAGKAAERSRRQLAQAIAARKQEEARREEQAEMRRAEEARLGQAIALRKAEESRLADARTEHSRLDEERRKLEAERVRLENVRQSLLAEVNRLKTAAAAPAVATASAPRPAQVRSAVAARPVVLANPPSAGQSAPGSRAAASRATPKPPRSITLRALNRVRAIDFVDEPGHASVIIDVEDPTVFAVERLGGRRLSLRIEHSDLPETLERKLDATEYLGPVKIISSYRDRAAHSTVRVDVDLAEDVPNRVRLEGNRIYWDFQKAHSKAPSLPAVLYVPARRVAGFLAMAKDGLWVAQAAPPFLSPPGTVPGATAPAAPAGSSAAEPAASAPAGPRGGAKSGRTALGKKRYTGRRIDLDFKGADIHNILRLLADVGQVNVIVADDVRGEITIKMRDVPWDQALDVILRSKGLGSVREGNLLRVAPLPLLEKELEAEIARQKQIQDVLPTETRLIGVSYAEASALSDKAKDLLTPRGRISVDQRTNTLIVSDVVKSLQLVEDLVRNLDTQTSQVVIEARIVEANSNFARQIGVQWGGTGYADTDHGNPTGLVFPYNVGIGGGSDDGKAPLTGLVPYPRNGDGTTNPNFLVNMPAAAGMGTGAAIGLTMGSVAGAFNLNLRLSAYESTGSVRILSSPRITTMDNLDATISQGVSIPVSTVSAMGAQTQFVDARLSLQVRPHVTNEGTIALQVNVTRNEPDFVNTGARGDPTIQRKEARTTMLVRDGDTAVIGGIYTRNTGLSSARIPYFSDIPVLGWFFRNKKENDNRSEFLVFITPRIVNRSRIASQ
ncbi:MAG: type IV pilus secretin PilQ [Deltaproteobacteria bacterium]|nr:type IV pilus secretin PilQ [Deltaproteobacteria bacterium]